MSISSRTFENCVAEVFRALPAWFRTRVKFKSKRHSCLHLASGPCPLSGQGGWIFQCSFNVVCGRQMTNNVGPPKWCLLIETLWNIRMNVMRKMFNTCSWSASKCDVCCLWSPLTSSLSQFSTISHREICVVHVAPRVGQHKNGSRSWSGWYQGVHEFMYRMPSANHGELEISPRKSVV